MSAIEYTQDTSAQSGLYRIVRCENAQLLWVVQQAGAAPRKVFVSARFSAHDVERWVAQDAQALVMPIAPDDKADIFGVAIDFILPARTALTPKPQVLCVDEIRFANGAARIFWDADALHIAADNIDTRARFIHRIIGGSIKIG